MAQTTAELVAQGKDVSKTLTEPERVRLNECESIIRKGLGTFLAVGQALAEIHDAMLYRETHKDFKRYCKDVWDLGQSTAYQQMDGYRVVKLLENKSSAIAELLSEDKEDESLCDVLDLNPDTLEPRGIVLPTNEHQARHLVKLKKDPAAQIKAWAIVQKNLRDNPKAKLTGALVGKAVKEVQGEVAKKTVANKLQAVKAAKKTVKETDLISKLFKNQYQTMLDIINQMWIDEWENDSQAEVVRYLETLVKVAKSND